MAKDSIILEAKKRTVVGKKVRQLRAGGTLPANVYGKGMESIPLAVAKDTFAKIHAQAGETGIIDLVIDGEKPRPVLIHSIQVDPRDEALLHADFYQVDLSKKVKVQVPIRLIGEAPAVKEKLGILNQPVNEVEVEALPTELPEYIEVDVSRLAAVDDEVTLKDLRVPSGTTISGNPHEVIVKVGPLVTAEMQRAFEEEKETAEAAKISGEEAVEKREEGEVVEGKSEERPAVEERGEKTQQKG